MEESLESKIDRIDRGLKTLLDNIPLLKRAVTDQDLKDEIESQKARVSESARRYIEKTSTKRNRKSGNRKSK